MTIVEFGECGWGLMVVFVSHYDDSKTSSGKTDGQTSFYSVLLVLVALNKHINFILGGHDEY